MRLLRWIEEDELEPWIAIARESFAGVSFPSVPEHLERTRERLSLPDVRAGAVFEEGRMVATFRVHDFTMNVRGRQVPTSGLGGVATALDRRGRGIARELVRWVLEDARRRGQPLASLYPFRPSFYTDLGYGPGAVLHRYRLLPASLPAYRGPLRVRRLGPADHEALAGCYAGLQARVHGLLGARGPEHYRWLERDGLRLFGALDGQELVGYLVLGFESGRSMLDHRAVVDEWHGVDGEARRALLGFLRGLRDQVERIELTTQDPWLQHLLRDPMDGGAGLFQLHHGIGERGLGILHRVLDPAALLETWCATLDPAQALEGVLELRVEDPLLEPTTRVLHVDLGQGRVLAEPREPALRLETDTGTLASLLLGVLPLDWAAEHGLARAEDPGGRLARALAVPRPPVCTTRF